MPSSQRAQASDALSAVNYINIGIRKQHNYMGVDHRYGGILHNLSATMLCLYILHFKWSQCLICK